MRKVGLVTIIQVVKYKFLILIVCDHLTKLKIENQFLLNKKCANEEFLNQFILIIHISKLNYDYIIYAFCLFI
jgi:hypothetical protein